MYSITRGWAGQCWILSCEAGLNRVYFAYEIWEAAEMMKDFDQQLYELKQKVVHRDHLKSQLLDLQEQCAGLRTRVAELAEARQEELEDVERLERYSLSAFYYKVTGKKEEKLKKERKEAYEAAIRYDAAVRELESVEQYIKDCELKIARLTGCEVQYEECLAKKEQVLKQDGGLAGKMILELEGQIGYVEQQEKETQEAIRAGKAALSTVNQVLEALDSADGWSTWDLLGGGLLADAAKYKDLDLVQERVEKLQKQLRRLKAELADVDIQTDLSVRIDDFLHFADYFFDGIFADMAVKEQINLSLTQAKATKEQIEQLILRLEAQQSRLTAEQERLKEQREKRILEG